MDRQFAVAVVGATGLVGEMMISVLEERAFPVAQLFRSRATARSASSVRFRGRTLPGERARGIRLRQWISRCSPPARRSPASTRRSAAAAGCIVIDNTSEFRY